MSKTSKKEPVPDSWEDDSESESEAAPPPQRKKEPTPPPAKSVPLEVDLPPFLPSTGSGPPESSSRPPDRRPVKSAATAQRLIAGALGVRVRPTAEQREYEKAIREKEKKKREEERERKKAEEAKPKESWGFDS
ncbi:hypothetical protein BJ508DRAFT_411438 [Ascobolus immersus RN42]|uniref:Uncharacterized protein n=1 Tax=Ascobolus immersus RN42 TaxID=1160509 RepID=A0A3N4IJD9_ASCIM|nr:hypothetical protein BJ508DRAFT_411438 [Ascobolus immersus RN42]